MLKRFRKAEQGNVAIVFALSLVPMTAFAGAAVDYSRAGSLRNKLQTATDAAALGAAVSTNVSTDQQRTDAVNTLARNAQSDYLKLRPWHRRAVDLPLYALQTDLTHGHVLRGARRFIAGSKIPRARSVLVDASATESHLDPLTAAPARNRFLQTVVPFLRKLRASSP